MKSRSTLACVAVVLLTLVGAAQKKDSPEALLGAGLHQEQVERNCREAIKLYERVVSLQGAPRSVIAEAQRHIGTCRETLRESEAPREMAQKIWSGRDIGGQLVVSPDGRYVVYTPRRGADGFVVHDVSAGTDRTVDLGNGGQAFDPFIMPDSKRILYTWNKPPEWSELRMVNLDGTGMRSLISGGDYVGYDVHGVTTDGKLAAVGLPRGGDWQIGLLSMETGKLQILKSLGWRSTWVGNFSPDGRWLVFSAQLKRELPMESGVYVIATDGSMEYPVVPSVRGIDTPLFTPDGSRVVFANNGSDGSDLWSVRVKDGKPVGAPEIFRHPGRNRRFSQDGTYFYSELRTSSSEYVVQVDPSTWKPKNAPARISDPFRNESVQRPYWSPDGKRLAYLSNAAEDRFVIHDFDSGQDRELPTRAAAGSLSLIGWFADGKSLQVAEPPMGTGFRLVDTETQQERPMSLTRAQQTVASHDGKAVFYATLDSAPYERGMAPASDTFRLIRRDLDTGADKELYRAEARPFGISLAPSPDGRSLAFAFVRPGENSTRLWILPLSGGEPRELLRNSGGSWTQDSRAILFVRSNEIWVQPIDGREPYATGITFTGLSAPSVSPDGGRIAFRGSTTTQSVWMVKNLPETSAAKR